MNVQFTTSNRSEAVERVRKAIPDASDDLVNYIGQLVDDEFVRVGDPMMYEGTAPIYPTPTCSVEKALEIAQKYREIRESE